MLLDTLATSKRALALYEKMGFVSTDRYNDNRKKLFFPASGQRSVHISGIDPQDVDQRHGDQQQSAGKGHLTVMPC